MIEETSASFSKTIGLTSKMLGIYFNEVLHHNGFELTLNQLIILKILSQSDGICQNDLAFITKRDKTSLTRLLKILDLKKLVKRKVKKHDKRKKMVFITEAGISMLNQAFPIIALHQDKVKANISDKELKTLTLVLNKIQANIIPLTNTEKTI